MVSATHYQLERLAAYPQEQWRLAVSQFRPPSNRPPQSFWRTQRDRAISWLQEHGVAADERCGRVYVGEAMVDGSYVEA